MAMTSTTRAWARGGTVLAATVLLLAGIFELFQGIAAIIRNNFYVVGANYVYSVNVRTWGWIHLGIGIAAILAGLGLFTGALWARILGVAIAAITAIANFFWAPYYPLWSLLVIGFSIFAIWAITRAGRDVMAGVGTGGTAGAYSGEYLQGDERWPSTNPAATTGRHYAGEPAKEGMRDRSATEREQAEAMAQQGRGGQQPGMGGQQPGTGQGMGGQGMGGQGMGQQGTGGQQPGQPGMPRDPNYPS
jgi:hypothetical protein